MTTTKIALKKLEQAGAKPISHTPRHYVYQMPAATVAVVDQDGDAISIYVKRNGAEDDLTTDYFAGTFRPNIKQAIELARHMESW